MIIIAISASFVTCCMSINTADFLCQCIVHVLGIRFVFFLLDIFGFFCFFRGIVWRGFVVYRAADHVHSSGWTFLLFIGKKKINWETKKKKKKHEKLLDSFGGLVLDCITTVSGVQSVIAECFLVYLCFTTSSKRKTSRVTFPPLQKQNVTIMQ